MNFLLFLHMQFKEGAKVLLLLILLFAHTLTARAQHQILEKSITLKQKNQPFEHVVKKLEEVSGARFIYSPSTFNSTRPLTVEVTNETLGNVIRLVFGNQASIETGSGNAISVSLNHNPGKISGVTLTSDSKPIGYVTISLNGKKIQADEKGRFVFTDIPPGTHTLIAAYVGVKKQRTTVLVKENENVEVTFRMSENAEALEEVIVNGERVNRFANKETAYVARMALTNIENPQVYSVVTKQLIQEQASFTIADAIRNATGTVSVTNPSGGVSAFFRGFGVGINARNGMESTTERSAMDLANVERIEVMKGPSGTLFGSAVSSFGGVVNLVTKKPIEAKRTELTYMNGSFGLNRLTVDVNSPLDSAKKVLFRANAALHRERSFLDYGFNNTFLFAPSLSYRVDERLTLNVDAEVLQVHNTQPMNFLIRSAAITQPSDILLDYRSTLYHDNVDVKNYATRVFAEAVYKISDKIRSTTLFSYVSENVERSYQRPVIWSSPTTATRASAVYGPVYNGYTNLQQNFNAELQTGFIKHNLLAGANFRNYSSNFLFSEAAIIDQVDITQPFQPVTRQDIDALTSFAPYPTPTQNTLSAYVSDMLTVLPRLSLMLSLRVDHFDRKATPGAEDEFKQTSLAPKLGVVYQVLPDRLSVFGNYMSGFQNIAPAIQPDGSRLVLNPIFAKQSEAGIKAELLGKRLSMTGSYYYIDIANATRLNAELFTLQDGQQVSKGFDLEVLAEPIRGLNLLAGYAFNDNRIVKASTDASIDGNKSSNAPENVANLWASYTLQRTAKGLGVGFGINYVDKMFRSTDNVFFIPSYTLANATLFYNKQAWGVQVKANNIFNERYWDNWGNAQAPANYVASLSFRF